MMTEGNKEVADVDKDVVNDEKLIEKAYNEIATIFSVHLEDAIIKTGKYLLKEFYNGKIELARTKKSPKKESLNRLIERLHESFPNSLSKTTIYQSIGLVVQAHDIENDSDEGCFQAYETLYYSHKVCLLSVKDIEDKKKLIYKIDKEGLSVRELGKAKKKLADTDKKTGILTLLNDPKKMRDEDNLQKLKLDSLKTVSSSKLERIKLKASEKSKELQKKLKKIRDEIEKNEQYVADYNSLKETVEAAIKAKKIEEESEAD